MPPVNLLIKPASSACGLACRYCFYADVAAHRTHACAGMLSRETLEHIIRAGMVYADRVCSFTFQGGEPTLAGLDFYRDAVALEQRYARPGVQVRNAIQTNGMCMDDAWAAFLAAHGFLVGLSLDGPADLHNANRVTPSGSGTFNQVMRAVRLLDKHGADYNILCVVTGRSARAVEKIYHFYRRQGFRWLQFIPCLEPLDSPRGSAAYHLSAADYGTFLIRLFDLWYDDLKHGIYVSIRHLDNWLAILLGEPPEVCSMAGQCAVQFIVEGDGGVYPCDFYVLDGWRMGTVGAQSLNEMARGPIAQRFIAASQRRPAECTQCRWLPLCRNGCRRDRAILQNGTYGTTCYCEAYRRFFSQRIQALYEAARLIQRLR